MAKEAVVVAQETKDSLAANRVTKANSLVQASYKLSLQEQRLVLAAIGKLDSRHSHMHPRNTKNTVRVTAVEFGETFGIDVRKKAYEELKDATNGLFERRITEIAGKKTTKFRWVSKVTYHDGEGWSEVTFADEILPLLTLLKEKFTSYTLGQIADLRSQYSIRIFEMVSQFQSTGMLRIELGDLISRLALPYTKYHDIARRVLDPAVAELRTKSNLDISWKGLKTKGSRSFTSIEFRFKEAAQSRLPLEPEVKSDK